MELIATALGLSMFVVGHLTQVHTVLVAVIGAAAVGVVMTVLGWAGIRWTRLRSPEATLDLVWGWLLFCLAVGGLGTWLVIGLTFLAKQRLGDKPTAFEDATAGAMIALVTAAIASRQQFFAQYGPGPLAQRFIQRTFRRPVGPLLVGRDNMDPQVLACRAVEEDEFAVPNGAVSGWGFRADCARLRLIRDYLVRTPQPALGPWRAPRVEKQPAVISGDPP